MDFNKYIKELIRNQIQDSEHLQRAKGVVESIEGNKIKVKLITSINQPSVTIKNNNGLRLTVGQNVDINHWGDISKGYISPSNFSATGYGVGQWLPIDNDNTTEIFNDYIYNGIYISDNVNELRGRNGERKGLYGHLSGSYNQIYAQGYDTQLYDFHSMGNRNRWFLGDNKTNGQYISCYQAYVLGSENIINVDSDCRYINLYNLSCIGSRNTLNASYGAYTISINGGYNTLDVKQNAIYDTNIYGNYNSVNCNKKIVQSSIIGHRNKYSNDLAVNSDITMCGCDLIYNLTSSNHNYANSFYGVNNSVTGEIISGSSYYENTLLGYGNHIKAISSKDISNMNIFGSHNSLMLDDSSACWENIILGIDNSLELCYSSNSCNMIVGIKNTIKDDSNGISDISVLGSNNYISDFYNVDNSRIIGSFNTLLGTKNDFSYNQTIIGDRGYINYNTTANADSIGILFAVSGNKMTLDKSGNLSLQGSLTSNGADYAEDWEWEDGNINNEDRRGLFVTFADNGYHIRIANIDDEILGVVSSNPSVVGGGDNFEWRGKYLKDVFGDYIYNDVQIPITTKEQKIVKEEYTDDDGVHHPPEYESIEVETGEYRTEKHMVLNPDFDDTLVYTNREYRPEHCYIAHLGKVVMVDDGTAEPNDYVTSSDGGIATKSETKTRARVLQRLDNNHILIWWE